MVKLRSRVEGVVPKFPIRDIDGNVTGYRHCAVHPGEVFEFYPTEKAPDPPGWADVLDKDGNVTREGNDGLHGAGPDAPAIAKAKSTKAKKRNLLKPDEASDEGGIAGASALM